MKSSTIIICICMLILILTLSLRYIIIDSSVEKFTGYQSDFHPSCNNNIDLYTTIALITTMPKYVYDNTAQATNNLDNFFIYSKPAQVDVEEVEMATPPKNELDIHKQIFKNLVATGKDFPDFVMVFSSQYKMPTNFTASMSNIINRFNMSNVDMVIFGGNAQCYIISKKFASRILADLQTSTSQTLSSLLKEKYEANNNILTIN